METIEQVEVMSDHANSRTNIEDLVGYGQYFILNVENKGYGKFIYDESSLVAFENNFGKI